MASRHGADTAGKLMSNRFAAPLGWSPDCPDPFSADGGYDCWSCFEIVEELDSTFKHGKASSGLFHMRFGPNVDRLEGHLADFLRYEPAHGRRVIVACSDADDLVRRALAAHPDGGYFSRRELKWLVHSTDLDAWRMIQNCGELRSFDRLRREGHDTAALGMTEIEEPDDYAEYVMFGCPGHIGPEHVVASRKRGEIFTHEDVPYTPGVRLYFDGHRIIDDGLAVYDGVHIVKVHDHLPLEPYLMLAVTAVSLGPGARMAEWTPRTFTEAADGEFGRICMPLM